MKQMDKAKQLADLIYDYPSEIVTRSGCEGLAKFLTDKGVSFTPSVFGRWIIHSSGHGKNATNWAECSECRVCGSPQWKVCPVCEAKMDPIHIPVNNYDPDELMGEYEDENV